MAYFNVLRDNFNIKDRNDLLLLARCFFLFVLQFLSFVYKPFVFVELFFAILFVLYDKYKNKLIYIIFLLPFYNVFRYGTDAVAYNGILSNLLNVYFSIFVLAVFVLVYLVRYVKDLINKEKHINIINTIIYLFMYLLLVLPIYSIKGGNLSALLVVTSLFVTVYLLYQYKKELDIKRLLNFWFFAIVLSVLTFLCKGFLPNLQEYLIKFNGRVNFLQRDPNYFSLEILLLLSCYTFLYFKGKVNCSFPYVFVTVSVLGLFASSKSFFICYTIYIIMLIVLLIKSFGDVKLDNASKTFNKILLAVMAVGIVSAAIIFRKQFGNIISRFVDAFSSGDNFYEMINDLTTDRLSIWSEYAIAIFNSWANCIFGVGIMSGYINDIAIHNTVLQLIYFGGVIWTVVLLSIIIYLVCKSCKGNKFASYMPLILTFVFSLSLDVLFSYRTFILVILIILVIDYNKDRRITKRNDISLSVIIPVYNADKYIETCVDSIEQYASFPLQIIIVNDGSTDNSKEVINKLKTKWDNIKVYNRTNHGVSATRNFGLAKATGDYVTFIDADDEVNENFGRIFDNVTNQDVVAYSFVERINNADYVRDINYGVYFNSVCYKIFNRQFLINNKITFDTRLVIAEDFKFCFDCFRLTNNYKIADNAYYVYKRNDSSAMADVTLKKLMSLINACEYAANNIDACKSKSVCKKMLSDNILSILARNDMLDNNGTEYNKMVSLIKYVNYASNIRKQIAVLSLRMLGTNKTLTLLGKRGKVKDNG